MLLSDAIATGRVTMDTIAGGRLQTCVLGMALNAVGRSYYSEPDGYSQLCYEWPWLHEKGFCPACGEDQGKMGDDYCHAIWHQFDYSVMAKGTMTLDQLIDWVRANEPPDAAADAAAPEAAPSEVESARTI